VRLVDRYQGVAQKSLCSMATRRRSHGPNSRCGCNFSACICRFSFFVEVSSDQSGRSASCFSIGSHKLSVIPMDLFHL
jgi:hypothetical protein